ncbi:Na+-dependent transporter [Vineibacter terrae]|uniref:Na+-dependent transporter n=1 Tax=Vineibacter terrae TaxID=2586908 RepID=A0A5C8PTW4_9HYPH|nr:Na+-dependent transporter [Vineibacter terrae]TXL81677.1 Na+-dependent transporter [Vineibacter terrae]
MTLASLLPIALQSSIFLLVLSLGLQADIRSALHLFMRPADLLRAIVAMNVLVPAFALAVILVFQLPHAVEVALVAIALSPVPPFLPLKAMKAGGQHAYTIGLLVAAALLSIVLIPLVLRLIDPLFPARLAMPSAAIAKVVALSVLLPLDIGILVRAVAPAIAGKAARPVIVTAAVVLVVALVPVLITAWPAILSLIGNGTVLALAALVAVGLAAGHALAGPASGESTVLALASGARHPGVAIALAHANFPDDTLVLPAMLLYLVVGALVAMPYVQWAKRSSVVPG